MPQTNTKIVNALGGLENNASLPSESQEYGPVERYAESKHLGTRTSPIVYLDPEKVRSNDALKNARISARIFNASVVPVLSIALELIVMSGSLITAAVLYHWFVFGQVTHLILYGYLATLLSLFFCIPSGFGRDHSLSNILLWRRQVKFTFLYWNSAYLVFFFVLFITYFTEFYSRGAILSQYFVGLVAALGVRSLTGKIVALGIKKRLIGGRRALVIGDNASVAFISRRLRKFSPTVELAGTVTFSPRNCSKQAGPPADNYVLAAKAAIEDIARRRSVDEIILALPYTEARHVQRLIDELSILPATLHLAPDIATPWAYQLPTSSVGSMPTLRLLKGPLSVRDRIVKRCFDLVVGGVLTLVALPIFALIGLIIKLDSRGPVFFRQHRHGFNQGEFQIFKFRTMTTMEDGHEFTQAKRDDKRITRLGRFLRRTNLDELPQLFNVLLGHMSLVGPRPHAVAHNDEFEKKIRLFSRRHNVKPGITGWSQINGLRGETDTLQKMQDRVRHDLYYIDNWSLKLDILIMIATLFSSKSYKNAY